MDVEMGQEELDLILGTLDGFAKRHIGLNTRLQWDEEEQCPEALIRELMGPEVGVHLAFIPAAYGGLGGGAKHIFRISETVAALDLGLATSLMGVSLGTDPIRVGGTPEQKQRWMGRVAEEGLLVAYAVTEPSAGSDLGAMKSTATPVIENGETVAYVLSGNKQFITNGGIADIFTVLAKTPGGPSFFVVDKGASGLEAGPPERKHGIRSSNTTTLALDEVRVPVENLIGGVEGRGMNQAKEVFGYTRVMVAAFGLGCGMAALGKAIAYGREREQGGSLLCEKTGWTHKLIVPHAVALEAARSHIEFVADAIDRGGQDMAVDGAVAKLNATEAGNAAAEAAIQALGGYGYTSEYEVEKIKRDVRITCIYEGTSEICQRTIAQDRWRRHLTSKGAYYKDLAGEMDAVGGTTPQSGATILAKAARALAETVTVWREAHLTRNQHVQFTLGWLAGRLEVAVAFARKVAANNVDSSEYDVPTLAAMSRLFAREVAQEIARESIAFTAGGHALAGGDLEAFERKIDLSGIHAAMGGSLDDMATVAAAIYGN